jgi:serine/threonine-protein kinase
MKKSRVDEAISSFEKALEADPTYGPAHTALGSAYHRKGFLKESIEHFEKSLALQPRVPTICNNLAWMLATCSDPSLRNGPRALALAQKANRLSTGSNPVFLRALAAAYAENGRFSEAAETAERALQVSNKAARREITQALQNERDLYRAGLPYHESGRGRF